MLITPFLVPSQSFVPTYSLSFVMDLEGVVYTASGFLPLTLGRGTRLFPLSLTRTVRTLQLPFSLLPTSSHSFIVDTKSLLLLSQVLHCTDFRSLPSIESYVVYSHLGSCSPKDPRGRDMDQTPGCLSEVEAPAIPKGTVVAVSVVAVQSFPCFFLVLSTVEMTCSSDETQSPLYRPDTCYPSVRPRGRFCVEEGVTVVVWSDQWSVCPYPFPPHRHILLIQNPVGRV